MTTTNKTPRLLCEICRDYHSDHASLDACYERHERGETQVDDIWADCPSWYDTVPGRDASVR